MATAIAVTAVPVQSQSTPGVWYTITERAGMVACTCPWHAKRGECKHALAYRASRLALAEPSLTAVEALRRARVR